MTQSELQSLLECARAPRVPGVRMDADVDQDILVGLIDGLGGDTPRESDRQAWADGIRIGNALRRALR